MRVLIAEELPHLPVQSMQPTSVSVWLPSRDGAPLARRSILQENGAGQKMNGAVALGNWQVTGLTIGAFDALRFLSQTRRSGSAASGAG
ncbi:MAG: hypothetical protein WHS90_12870, partial [Caldilinea sp.]